jgi:hypothetical protein
MSAVPRPTIVPLALSGRNWAGGCAGYDVEVPVKIERLQTRADAAANDARLLEFVAPRKLDQLRREAKAISSPRDSSKACTSLIFRSSSSSPFQPRDDLAALPDAWAAEPPTEQGPSCQQHEHL